ncbi:tyrosine-type recombinase/integrase [Paracoccus alkanivorans]|uniref:Tyr recombinase domain-containing protein n=1 Tax=Paracoccus alkanivorans TaxID=2116655 RepID=A0A3M0MDD0_9RHOB|nr:tyrosine-type recombinase/integrase [Paracoccus alkanivorans]RMC35345.1 hypothetical protein C9E81_08875 [Paracoccus alkanivorans]
MRKPDLPYLVTKERKGGKVEPYFRKTWTVDGKRRERWIPLPEDMESREFLDAYWDIRTGKAEAVKPKARETWNELIVAYKSSAKYRKLAASTKPDYDRVMNEISEKNGGKPVASMTRKAVMAIHAKYADTPRKADRYIQMIRLLMNFAKDQLRWKIENVADKIELYGRQREYEDWPDWMVAKLPEAPEKVRTAAELILGTGQRPNAAINMRRDQFVGDGMFVTDEKGNETYEVYCPDELRNYLAELPVRGAYVLAKNLTQPLGYDSIEKAFRAWRKTLGDRAQKYTLHGLRKLAIVRLAEADCTDAQIQAITNQSAEMVAYYRKRANRKRLSKAAHTRRSREEQHGNGT